MNLIAQFIKKFFHRVESTTVLPPTEEELVEGQAFKIKHYQLNRPVSVVASDTITGTIIENGETVAAVSEPMHVTMQVNTISSIRFNDSLGFKHAVGVVFGERNWVGDTPDDMGYRGGKVNNDERQRKKDTDQAPS